MLPLNKGLHQLALHWAAELPTSFAQLSAEIW